MEVARQLRNIAWQVRRWAENEYTGSDGCGWYDNDLCGLCAVASGEIWKRLKAVGADPLIVYCDMDWSGHCYVLVEGYVIDVTATQFFRKMPRVVVRKHTRAKQEWWDISQTFKNIRSFRDWQKRSHWPENQTVKI